MWVIELMILFLQWSFSLVGFIFSLCNCAVYMRAWSKLNNIIDAHEMRCLIFGFLPSFSDIHIHNGLSWGNRKLDFENIKSNVGNFNEWWLQYDSKLWWNHTKFNLYKCNLLRLISVSLFLVSRFCGKENRRHKRHKRREKENLMTWLYSESQDKKRLKNH